MSSSPTISNSNKTFTLDPYDNLTHGITYKTRLTTGVKDRAGNTLSSQYQTSSGFTTWSGTLLFGTTADDRGYGVTVDNSSNIYVTGLTKGALDNYTNPGGEDIFFAKYDISGNKKWLKQWSGNGNAGIKDSAKAISIDSSGNIYITGYCCFFAI